MSEQLTMVVMLVITGGAALLVAWPLMFGRVRPEDYLECKAGEPYLSQLLTRRDSAYRALKELEFDLAVGNLSREDYRELHERYKRRAVSTLKRIDDAKTGKLTANESEDEGEDFEILPPPRTPADPRCRPEPRADLDVEMEIEAFRRESRRANREEETGGQ